jgi:hypothetical protein
MQTITAGRGGGQLVEPFVIRVSNGGWDNCRVKAVDGPLGTLTTQNNFGLCQPFIMTNNFPGSREHDARYAGDPTEPLPTITSQGNRFGVVTPSWSRPPGMFEFGMDVDSVDAAAPDDHGRRTAT